MKRFWLEEEAGWHWIGTVMKPREVPSVGLVAILILLLQLVPSLCTVGQTCSLHKLNECSQYEKCVQVGNSTSGVCRCVQGYVVDQATNHCEKAKPPPDPSGGHLGLGLGLGLTFFLLAVVAVLVVLHRKFGLLAGMCDGLPSINPFGIRSSGMRMMDNENDDDDDVNPIA